MLGDVELGSETIGESFFPFFKKRMGKRSKELLVECCAYGACQYPKECHILIPEGTHMVSLNNTD